MCHLLRCQNKGTCRAVHLERVGHQRDLWLTDLHDEEGEGPVFRLYYLLISHCIFPDLHAKYGHLVLELVDATTRHVSVEKDIRELRRNKANSPSSWSCLRCSAKPTSGVHYSRPSHCKCAIQMQQRTTYAPPLPLQLLPSSLPPPFSPHTQLSFPHSTVPLSILPVRSFLPPSLPPPSSILLSSLSFPFKPSPSLHPSSLHPLLPHPRLSTPPYHRPSPLYIPRRTSVV